MVVWGSIIGLPLSVPWSSMIVVPIGYRGAFSSFFVGLRLLLGIS